jgi:hypothetical protein
MQKDPHFMIPFIWHSRKSKTTEMEIDQELLRVAGCWWLTHVILATWEAEIKEDRSSKPAWANSSQRPYLKNTQ